MKRCGLLLCLGLLALLSACGRRGPAPAGKAPVATSRTKVVVYSPHGREMLEPFEQRFEQAHPETDLEWLDMGSQEVLDRLRAEKANPYADVWWGAPQDMFTKAANEGLLAAYQPTWRDQLPAARRDPADRWYGQYLTPAVIVYNTEALTAEQAPQDWDDLLKPEWHDKILIRSPLESGTMRTFFAAMIQRQPDEEKGFDWLRKLHANTKDYPANPALLHRQISAQEGVVTVWALRDVEIQKRVNHYPLGYVVPKSGCPIVLDAIALVAGGKHAEAAKVFYEWVTAPEQLYWAAEQFDCLPAQPDLDEAKLPERMPRKLPELKLDWDRIQAKGGAWMDQWKRTVRTEK